MPLILSRRWPTAGTVAQSSVASNSDSQAARVRASGGRPGRSGSEVQPFSTLLFSGGGPGYGEFAVVQRGGGLMNQGERGFSSDEPAAPTQTVGLWDEAHGAPEFEDVEDPHAASLEVAATAPTSPANRRRYGTPPSPSGGSVSGRINRFAPRVTAFSDDPPLTARSAGELGRGASSQSPRRKGLPPLSPKRALSTGSGGARARVLSGRAAPAVAPWGHSVDAQRLGFSLREGPVALWEQVKTRCSRKRREVVPEA
mmetsp:Transcript_67490/g.154720  ORF Transcript_67490/g.154720 Transcript_67490/m.154720 type:complete len:256 (-) Transcript_67490:514-1281(-)